MLEYFINTVSNDITKTPNTAYRELQQAFINDQWANTVAVETIMEQDMTEDEKFPEFKFHRIEAWMNYVVGQGTTTKKNGEDYVQLLFRCMDHPCVRGRFYKFNNNYYIGDFTDTYDSIVKVMTVRRCNNALRMIDPANGSIFSIPCVVSYDMMSPSAQVSKYLLTPNNHATIITQTNADTLRLFKINTRFILGGRPFKLYAYQNAILDNLIDKEPSLLYLDLYLDELHAQDDIENQIAYNGEYDYNVVIENDNMRLQKGSQGKLTADVILNGKEVNKNIKWKSSNIALASINEKGEYSITGSKGKVNITAFLEDNEQVSDMIEITIVESSIPSYKINFTPNIEEIREGETVIAKLSVVDNFCDLEPKNSTLSLAKDKSVLEDDNIVIKEKGNNTYELTCINRDKALKTLYITASNEVPAFTINEELNIKLSSMFG